MDGTTDIAPKEQNLGIGGLSLHFATWGEHTTPERAVLLIHGLTSSSRAFAQIGPALAARGLYAVAPDLRGRGLSDKPRYGYGIPVHAADLLTLCDALGLESCAVAGHSLGALIGLFLAAFSPQRVSKLVLLDAGGKVPDDTLQAIAVSLSRLGRVYPSLDDYLATMRQNPVHEWNSFWEAYYRYDADVHPDGTVASRVPRSAIDQENAATFSTRTEALSAFVRAPTLIVRATVGTLAPDRGFILPADEAERLQAAIPGSQLVAIPGANHYTLADSPAATEAVAAFLSGER